MRTKLLAVTFMAASATFAAVDSTAAMTADADSTRRQPDTVAAVPFHIPMILQAQEKELDYDNVFSADVPEVNPEAWVDTVLVHPEARNLEGRFTTLTEDDYREVAEELGVETAAMKAVVDVEAGKSHQGFWAPGKPLINFDLTMYRKFASRYGVNLTQARKQAPESFARPDVRHHGSYQAAQQARLDAACGVNRDHALESTFWGMFQIGGFNWKKCGTASVEEFVNQMSRSERDQLELFAKFISQGGMADSLRAKNWLRFALSYNGPKAKARGYHKRLAAAYKRHKALEKQQ